MADELKPGDRVLVTDKEYVNHKHKGVVEKVEGERAYIKWDKGAPSPGNQRWAKHEWKALQVIDWFEEGDKVRLREEVSEGQLEEINIDGDAAKAMGDAVGEFQQYASDPEDDLPVEVIFDLPHMEATFGFKPGMLRAVYKKGDKVLVRDDAVAIRAMKRCSVANKYIELMKGKVFEVRDATADNVQLAAEDGDTWWFPITDAVVTPSAAHLEAEKAGFDPMTEPIHVGDLVEIVYDDTPHKGKRGRVYDVDDPQHGSWRVKDDSGEYVGTSASRGSWGRRDSLKLLEKADGSSAAKPKKEKPPAPPFAKGDKVRNTYTTRELVEYTGNGVVQCARMAGKVGDIIMTDGTEPKWFVNIEGTGGQWMHTDKLVKLNV